MSTSRDNLKGLEEKDEQHMTMQNIGPKGHNETTIDSSTNKHPNAITDGPSGSSQPQIPQVEVGGPRRSKRIDDIEKKALEKATSGGNPPPAIAAPATRRRKTIPKARSQLAQAAAPKARLIMPPPQPEAQPAAPKARLILPAPKLQLQPEAQPAPPKARLIMPAPGPQPQAEAQPAPPKARLIMPAPGPQPQAEAQPAPPRARLIMPAPVPSLAAAPKARLIMPAPQPETLPVAPKALPEPKGGAKKSTVKPTGTVRRTRKVAVPAHQAPAHQAPAHETPTHQAPVASTNKANTPDARLLQVQKVVETFQDGLTRLREALSNMAGMPAHTPPGSINRETVFQGFRAEMGGLEGKFPALVNEMNGLADVIMRSPQENRPEETDAPQEDKKEKRGRKPANKTKTATTNKKRSRRDDDGEEENAGRHAPRPKLTHTESQTQSAFGQGEASTSTRGKRLREEATDENDDRRPRKVAKGKGKETLTTVILPEYTSMGLPQNSPPNPLDFLATVALQWADVESTSLQEAVAGPSSSRMASMGKR